MPKFPSLLLIIELKERYPNSRCIKNKEKKFNNLKEQQSWNENC